MFSTHYRYTNNCRRNHDRSCHSAPDDKSAQQNNTRYSAPSDICSNCTACRYQPSNDTTH